MFVHLCIYIYVCIYTFMCICKYTHISVDSILGMFGGFSVSIRSQVAEKVEIMTWGCSSTHGSG